MESTEVEVNVGNLTEISKIDPLCFDVTISSLLNGIGAEEYIEIFRKHNIGQCTLMELSDEDLQKLGVDDQEIRHKIIQEAQNLPIYIESSVDKSQDSLHLSSIEIADVLDESAQHLYRIHLSILASTLAVKKSPNIRDCLLYHDKYASDIALATLGEINRILNSMDLALHTHKKTYAKDAKKVSKKKIVVGAVGGVTIAILAVLFVSSLKKL